MQETHIRAWPSKYPLTLPELLIDSNNNHQNKTEAGEARAKSQSFSSLHANACYQEDLKFLSPVHEITRNFGEKKQRPSASRERESYLPRNPPSLLKNSHTHILHSKTCAQHAKPTCTLTLFFPLCLHHPLLSKSKSWSPSYTLAPPSRSSRRAPHAGGTRHIYHGHRFSIQRLALHC